MKEAIKVLVEKIKNESGIACENYDRWHNPSLSKKARRLAEEDYVNNIRSICSFTHAIQRLNEA